MSDIIQDPGTHTTEELKERLVKIQSETTGSETIGWDEILRIAFELADRVHLCEQALQEASSTPFDP